MSEVAHVRPVAYAVWPTEKHKSGQCVYFCTHFLGVGCSLSCGCFQHWFHSPGCDLWYYKWLKPGQMCGNLLWISHYNLHAEVSGKHPGFGVTSVVTGCLVLRHFLTSLWARPGAVTDFRLALFNCALQRKVWEAGWAVSNERATG